MLSCVNYYYGGAEVLAIYLRQRIQTPFVCEIRKLMLWKTVITNFFGTLLGCCGAFITYFLNDFILIK